MFQSFHFKRKIEALWKEHGWLVALPWGCAGSLARGGGVSQMCVAVITLPGQCLGGANLFLSPSPGEQEHAACPAPWVPLTWAPLAQQGWGGAAHPPLLPHCPPPPSIPSHAPGHGTGPWHPSTSPRFSFCFQQHWVPGSTLQEQEQQSGAGKVRQGLEGALNPEPGWRGWQVAGTPLGGSCGCGCPMAGSKEHPQALVVTLFPSSLIFPQPHSTNPA